MHQIDFEHPLAVRLRKTMVEAMAEYKMIENGDRIMVCCSGGKDSSILLALLSEVQKRAPYKFEFEAVMLDQGHPGFDPKAFAGWVESLGVKLTVLQKDTYSIVKEKVTSGVYCSMCSRLRRGILYDHAHNNGFTKMALGHHRDDLSETLLMNLFYTGKLAAMPPKLKSDDGRNILIRPLSFIAEKDLKELAALWKFPIIPCNLCGSQEGMKRQRVKKLIGELEQEIPFLGNSMLKAMSNIRESQLMDHQLWDFVNLKADSRFDGSELEF
ncbi:MAG: tRNA 2-thiocytidine(32) synthetase TtcA [Pseudobdellovibrionaceae bacterium]